LKESWTSALATVWHKAFELPQAMASAL